MIATSKGNIWAINNWKATDLLTVTGHVTDRGTRTLCFMFNMSVFICIIPEYKHVSVPGSNVGKDECILRILCIFVTGLVTVSTRQNN